MERREFLAKSIIAAAAVSVAPSNLLAADSFGLSEQDAKNMTPTIIENKVIDGIRYVVAVPCESVCSKQIDIQIDTKTNTIKSCAFTRGCPGNSLGLCSLLVGMKVEDAIKRLEGTPCGKRPTSCPDQLARVLKML